MVETDWKEDFFSPQILWFMENTSLSLVNMQYSEHANRQNEGAPTYRGCFCKR